MAIKLSAVINTSAFLCQLLFINTYCRMNITLYCLNTAGMNSFMGLYQGVNNCLSMYNYIAVLRSWISLDVDNIYLLFFFIKEHG